MVRWSIVIFTLLSMMLVGCVDREQPGADRWRFGSDADVREEGSDGGGCADRERTCNGRDEDCDGQIDENLTRSCPKTQGVCSGTAASCQNGRWSGCGSDAYGSDYVADEGDGECDGLDNDCDGTVDEECSCDPGSTRSCYTADPETRGVGPCEAGTQTCGGKGDWGACRGEITPESEECNETDDDCDGVVDEGCSCNFDGKDEGVCSEVTRREDGTCPKPSNYEGETDDESACSFDDNDCDGVVDEGCPCDYKNKSTGVCAGVERRADGTCPKPKEWQPVERNRTDGVDNDCDGTVDEVDFAKTVSAGFDHACGTDSSGTITCWGNGRYGATSPPSGTFWKVRAGKRISCALTKSGKLNCWGRSEWTPDSLNGSDYVGLTMYDHVCVRSANGDVECGGGDTGDGTNAPSVKFRQIDAGEWATCGVERNGGAIRCWGSSSLHVVNKVPSGTYRQVSVGLEFACAVDTGGRVDCWGRSWRPNLGSRPKGKFRYVTVGTGQACGLRSDGSVSCWRGGGKKWPAEPTESFKRVDVGVGFACGVTDKSQYQCWGNGGSVTNPP